MRFIYRVIVASLFVSATVIPANAALSPTSIPAVFDELLKNQRLSNPAMVVIDGSTGQVIYEKNGFSQRKPASVMKLLTSAAVVQKLELDSTFNTSININPDIKTVIIRGSFDPWISLDHKTARKMSRASLPYMGFETLKGVKAFNGGSLKNYKVIYSDLFSQDISNLKTFWAKRGFKPTFSAVSDEEAFMALGQQIASENSPTVAALIDWILLWSDNVISERLARLSAKAAGYPMSSKGVDMVFREVLAGMQIDASKLVVADASGLSRKNKITAKLMAEFLYKIRQDERYSIIYSGLPIGGVSGTLRSRFITTAPSAVGLVRAKTGTLNGTATLAGYVESTDREYVFVTLADEIPSGNTALNRARDAIDRVLGRIAAPNIPAEISATP
jgi:D-alanyl-D-alanine carboxypeptidase/D-alanyl-D-alanine-endopeptidase (penicillin-binding protein 4)